MKRDRWTKYEWRVDRMCLGTIVAHRTAGVAAVEDPAKVLSKLVRGIDNTREETHDDVPLLAPLLDSEVLHVHVAGAFGRTGGVDHVDGGLVVFMEDGRAALSETEFVEDGSEILGDFGGTDGSDEFGFGGASGNGRLDLCLVGDSSAGEAEAEASDRATGARACGMRGIDETGEFKRREASRETRKCGVSGGSSV